MSAVIKVKVGGDVDFATLATLPALLAEIGWYHVQRASFTLVRPFKVPLELTDVGSDVDDAFRYYSGNLREARTGVAVVEGVQWDEMR